MTAASLHARPAITIFCTSAAAEDSKAEKKIRPTPEVAQERELAQEQQLGKSPAYEPE
jgi:hypothetical protein